MALEAMALKPKKNVYYTHKLYLFKIELRLELAKHRVCRSIYILNRLKQRNHLKVIYYFSHCKVKEREHCSVMLIAAAIHAQLETTHRIFIVM